MSKFSGHDVDHLFGCKLDSVIRGDVEMKEYRKPDATFLKFEKDVLSSSIFCRCWSEDGHINNINTDDNCWDDLAAASEYNAPTYNG